jgi:uncharacterized phage protein gp47/JayE
MPWLTPSLKSLRATTRDNVLAKLRAKAMVPNSVTRIVSDAMAGLAYLCLLYVDWLAKQLLPDTAEDEWLERQGVIWLVNADGTRGRKPGSCATGIVTMTGQMEITIPLATRLSGIDGTLFETTEQIMLGNEATPVHLQAMTVGVAGNLDAGMTLSFVAAIPGVDGQATVLSLQGGAEAETIDELRGRVLERIQQPPMGGDAEDYVAWATRVAGVTRAWCAPNEMGIGTVTVRFMCDDLRAGNGGFPLQEDIDAVQAYLDIVRPVAVKDFFVVAPIPLPIDFTIAQLDADTAAIRAAIEASVAKMLRDKAKPAFALNGVLQPAQTIFAAWVSDAILNTPGVNSFDLNMDDRPMPNNGCMAVPGVMTVV